MKKLTELRKEKPTYFVCVNGEDVFESESLAECKKWLCSYLKTYAINKIKIANSYDYYIGMFSITID